MKVVRASLSLTAVTTPLQIRTPPIGFRKPPGRRYTTDRTLTRPVPYTDGCEPNDFVENLRGAFPELLHPVRKIVFTVESRDQGWSSRERSGQYINSWTWFEAGLERFDPEDSCKYGPFLTRNSEFLIDNARHTAQAQIEARHPRAPTSKDRTTAPLHADSRHSSQLRRTKAS